MTAEWQWKQNQRLICKPGASFCVNLSEGLCAMSIHILSQSGGARTWGVSPSFETLGSLYEWM